MTEQDTTRLAAIRKKVEQRDRYDPDDAEVATEDAPWLLALVERLQQENLDLCEKNFKLYTQLESSEAALARAQQEKDRLERIIDHSEPISSMTNAEVRAIAGFQRDARTVVMKELIDARKQVALAQETIQRLQNALAELIGTSDLAELRQMEIELRAAPAPTEDKIAAINGIHALQAALSATADPKETP